MLRLDNTQPALTANGVVNAASFANGPVSPGEAAPITYAGSNQVNVVVPYSVSGKTTTPVRLEYLGFAAPAFSVTVAATAPGVFAVAGGKGPGAILNAADSTMNSAANPGARGDWVSIFATGAGTTSPAGVDGLLAAAPCHTLMPRCPLRSAAWPASSTSRVERPVWLPASCRSMPRSQPGSPPARARRCKSASATPLPRRDSRWPFGKAGSHGLQLV